MKGWTHRWLLGSVPWWGLCCAGCLAYEPVPTRGPEPLRSVAEVRAERPADETVVFVGPAIVLAHDTYDESGAGREGTVYLADPGQPPEGTLQLFSPQVVLDSGAALHPGDVVRARGPFVHFRGPGCRQDPGRCFAGERAIDQLGQGSRVERIGVWREPEPVEVAVADYLADPARFQGRLITLRGLTIQEGYRPSARGDRIEAAGTEEGVFVGAELYRVPGLEAGVRLARLTGVSTYFFRDVVQPRGPQDVEFAP